MQQPTQEQEAFRIELQDGDTSIQLDAVAGSGKTTAMVYAAQDLPKGTRVLACAFNAKIAKELESRLPSSIECATLNALGHRAWQRYVNKKLKLDTGKVGKIASEICKEFDLERETWFVLVDLIKKAKAHGLVPEKGMPGNPRGIMQDTDANWEWIAFRHNIPLPHAEQAAKELIQLARHGLCVNAREALDGLIDFDDQLYMTAITRAAMHKYQIVLVDEAQDLSQLQHKLISMALDRKGRLIAVGDPRQAIYGFRGADINSLDTLAEKFSMKHMTLSYNFRCGKAIIAEAQKVFPGIHAHESNPEGKVTRLKEWMLTDLLVDSAVVCRNVAPLVKLGFKCIREGIGVHMQGRDMGKGILALAKKFKGETAAEVLTEIQDWKARETLNAKAKQDLERQHWVDDMAETLTCIQHYSEAGSIGELLDGIHRLFDARYGQVTLSTVHRAKGLEWDTVFFLDSFLVPAKYALRAAEDDPEGCSWMLDQESNIRYIAITRAKHELVYINSDKLEVAEPEGE